MRGLSNITAALSRTCVLRLLAFGCLLGSPVPALAGTADVGTTVDVPTPSVSPPPPNVSEVPDAGSEPDEPSIERPFIADHPDGKIRIQKTVVDAAGQPVPGAQLDGFVFEIRDPATQAVVRTVQTNAEGVVSQSLNVGTYDVVETDSRGLIDVTGPAGGGQGVVIVENRFTDVVWTNQTEAGEAGRIRIKKTVVDAGGLPIPGAALDGFVFEIRDPGTQNVLGTVVTNAEGVGLSALLAAGTYEVVESDSRGLIDVTGPAGGGQGLVVVTDQITEVGWSNRETAPGTIRIQKTVVDAGGLPVPGAPLAGFVFEIRSPGPTGTVETVVTNADGMGLSGPLEAGKYEVVESDSRGLIDVTGPTSVTVTAGQTTEVGWDNQGDGPETGRIQIQKAVVDAGGLPIPGAALDGFVFEIRDPGTQSVLGTVVTNADGVGLSALLAAGTYDVVESDSRGLIDVTGPTSVTVTAGQTTEIGWDNQGDGPETGRIQIQKAVVDVDGLPIPGAALDGFVFEIRDPGTQSVLGTVVTNADGVGLSALLAAGTYDVVESDSRGLIDVTGPTSVTVTAGQTTEIGWDNQGDGPETGRIQIQKAVVDADGLPIPGAALDGFVFEIRDPGTQNVLGTVVTNAEGVGLSALLAAGTYDVVESDSRGLIDVTGPTSVTVTAGQTAVIGWDNQGDGPETGRIQIQKAVVDAGGLPIPGAALDGFVFEIRDPGTQSVLGTVVTNADGVGLSALLAAGTYDVVESDSRGLIDVTGPTSVTVTAGQTAVIGWDNQGDGPETGRIQIQKAVVDAGGLPIPGAALDGFVFEIRDPGTQSVLGTVVTNADGVGLSALLAAGTYDVVESDSRGLIDVTGPTSVTVTAGQTTEIGWDNQGDGPETGRIQIQKAVVDADGLPIPGAALDGFVFEIRDPGTQSVLGTVVTNADGVGLSALLAAGTYDVVESDSRGLIDVTGPTSVTVTASQTTEIGWDNQGDGPETGRIQIQKAVVDADGRPVRDAPLGGFAFQIRDPATQSVLETVVTNAAGVGLSGPLAAGTYDVVETNRRGLIDVTGPATVTVTVGDTAELAWTNQERVELPPRIRIRKAVVDASGSPVPGASRAGFVFEIREQGTQAVAETVITNVAGIGRSGPLAPGTYDVVETDSRRLTDVTGPAGGGQGIVAVPDQTTDVSWLNTIDDGRIRIQKNVVNADGLPVPGAALAGFVFEIRNPATRGVLETLITNTEGVGLSEPLAPGTYDVVETDSRGLTDVTGPAGGGQAAVVVADQTTDVSWTNATHDGRIRIQKTVVDAVGQPVPGASLAGFVFEIQDPATQTVHEVVVTDDAGLAMSQPLAPGTYDVVETNSRGLMDVTGLAGGGKGVVVASGQTTDVDWVNERALPGALRIQKVVVDAGGQPVPGASLAGFVFEIRNPETQAVLGRITTDDQGAAPSDTLPPGAYVLVETDSRGHTDITGPTTTTVSPGDTAEVAWLNRLNPLDVGITKAGPATAAPGDRILYTLTVSNLRADTVHRFTVRDSLPPGVQLVSFPEAWMLQADELYSDTLGPLAPMDSVSYEIAVVATAPGTIRNVVRVRAPGDDNPSNDRAELDTQVRVSPFSDEGLIVGRVYYTTCVTAGYDSPGCDIHDPGGDSASVEVDCACVPVADSLLPFTTQEEREVGIPGVRVYLQDGTSAVTDSEGRYHFFGLRPMLWIAKVDATTLPASEEAYLVPLTNRHGGDGYSVFVDLKRSELARADFVEGSRSAAVAEETLLRRAETLMDGVTQVGGDPRTGVETETEYLFYSHLLPVSGQIPGDSTARPPVPPGSVLTAGPPQGRSLLAMGLVEARLDLRSLANGELGLAGERDRFEDELKSFQLESDDGEVSAGARAALFVKGTVADNYELTFRLESEETEGSRLFRDIRPDELYPVYGDGSVREFDAQSRGRVFGRVQRGASYLTLGDFNTGLGSYGQTGSRALGQYSRTLNGVLEHYENTRVAINAFASHDRFSQVVDELPAEGISGPYQLKRTDGLINSEKVELITRDRDQHAVILRTRSMERFTDYTIEPFTGRLIFKQPISGLDADLNPVSIRVTYEAEGGGDRFWVYGADGQVRPWQNVEIGGGLVRDENPRAEFDLVSLNATVDMGRGTYAFGEFARTDGSAYGNGEARRFGLRHTSGRLTANMLFLDTDSTFNNPSASFGTGRRELSFRATAHLDEKTRVLAEALKTEDRRTGGSRTGGRIGIERAINDWLDGQVAYRHADESETPATDLSAQPTSDVNSVAAQLRATPPQMPKLAISAEFESDVAESDQRRAWVGADYDMWDRGRAYARHEFINSFSGLYGLNPEHERNATVLGISAAYRPGQSVFSEYRVRDVVGGREAQAAIGLRNTWEVEAGTRLSASVERLAPLSAGGSTATALTGGAEFTGDSLWLGSLRAEYWDRNGTDQVFGSIGYGRKLSSDLSFLGNSVFSKELSGDRAFERTRLGIAWRETYVSRWNALARYEHRYDADPRATDAETKREAHIFWGHLSYRPSTPLVLRATAASKSVAGERGPIEFEEQSQLLALRNTFDVTTRIDLGLIGRAVFSAFPDDAQYGLGAEVGVLLSDNLRLAIGYNAFGFSDAEFSAHEATDHGPYLHVGFKFDEALFGRRKAPSRPPARLRCPDLCSDPEPTGTITVHKTVVDTARRPVPGASRAGFGFRVTRAGSTTTVTTLVTDGVGVRLSEPLDPGSYDVVETDSRGLIDVTGPAGGRQRVVVVAGQNTDLLWTNRQRPDTVTPNPEPTGTITVHKTVVDAAGRPVPTAPRAGFGFRVTRAGWTTPVTTLVTNDEGVRLSEPLDPGSYDVVETDSRGLIDVTGPAGGRQRVVVVAGQNTDLLWTNRQRPDTVTPNPEPTGTITVHKTVVDAAGRPVPTAPRAGFGFRVTRAGWTTPVTTLVTNDEGVRLSEPLDPGSYDVVETDSRGLIDVTGPAGGRQRVVVVAGQNTDLLWTNRQRPDTVTPNPEPTGTITVHKTVVDAAGRPVPTAPRAGFGFRVTRAGWTTPVTTLVTNDEGVRLSEPLDPGSYDVVETDSRGLIDVTGPAGGRQRVVVVAGQNTDLLWTNRQRPWVPPVTPDCPGRWRVCKQHMGPDSVATHETVGYTIHVRNLGGDILLQDHLPAGAELVYASRDPSRREYVLAWPSFRLAVGETRTDTVVLRVPARTGRMVNLAVANRDSSSVRTVVTDSVPEMDIVARGPVRARTGDTIQYTLTISNRGDVAAQNVVVSAVASPETAVTILSASDNASVTGSVISWDTIAVLGAGEADTVEVTVITPESLGLIFLRGRVTAEGGDLEDSSTAFTVLPPLVAATVAKLLLDPRTVGRGETVGYRIVVGSPPESLTDTIVIRDLLPVGAELISASGNPTLDGSTLTWPPLLLPELGMRVDTVVVRIPDVLGRLCNVLEAERHDSVLVVDSIPGPCVTVADSAPALDVSIRGPTRARLGTTLKYRVRIANWTGAPLTDAVVFDTLPENVTLVRASHRGAMVASRTWAWDPVETLDAGGVQEYEITVRAPRYAPNNTALISMRVAGVSGSLSDHSTAYTLVVGECSLGCQLVETGRRLWYWIRMFLPTRLDPLIGLALLALLVLSAGGYMLTRLRVTTVRQALHIKIKSEKPR